MSAIGGSDVEQNLGKFNLSIYDIIFKFEILIFFFQISIIVRCWSILFDNVSLIAFNFKFKFKLSSSSSSFKLKQTFPLKISRPHQCFLPVFVLYGRFPQRAGDTTFQSNLRRLWSRILSFECIQPPHEKLSPEEEKNGRRNRDSARALQKEKTTSSPSYWRWPSWKGCK